MVIDSRTFIVTGAGSGLGRATAVELAGAGARVLCLDVDVAGGEGTAAAIGGKADFVRADVTSEPDVAGAVEQAGEALAGAVNCAGIGIAERTVGRDGPHALDSFARVIQINLVGTFNVIRLVAAALAKGAPGRDGERGVIVNTASVAAYEPQIGQAAYGASKGGVVALTLAAARDLSNRGVRVCSIAPGLFDTPLLASLPAEARESLAASIPYPPRLGDPDEFARLVEHIVTNRMLNGETIRLDGAIRMAPR
jgi:NAD(P)-dependent dehydrogenase (short-subunit alcohol dehydrogenase family)